MHFPWLGLTKGENPYAHSSISAVLVEIFASTAENSASTADFCASAFRFSLKYLAFHNSLSERGLLDLFLSFIKSVVSFDNSAYLITLCVILAILPAVVVNYL